ncbi:hypothetical protein PBI_ROPE_97 [Mycobacterium phage Rope]|uniref:Uncharacterized protein n=1 Tax=Mycobacterium phage Rope TaxID=2767563 RepID=A0A7G9V0F0_9CAUD|nr:hypothetical protein PBI_ROPE_97 [Mycobacterium phage Rope]
MSMSLGKTDPRLWMLVSLGAWTALFFFRLATFSDVTNAWGYGVTVAGSVLCSIAFGYNLCRVAQCLRKRRQLRQLANKLQEREEFVA